MNDIFNYDKYYKHVKEEPFSVWIEKPGDTGTKVTTIFLRRVKVGKAWRDLNEERTKQGKSCVYPVGKVVLVEDRDYKKFNEGFISLTCVADDRITDAELAKYTEIDEAEWSSFVSKSCGLAAGVLAPMGSPENMEQQNRQSKTQ